MQGPVRISGAQMGVSPAGSLCPHRLRLRGAWVIHRDLSGSWDLQTGVLLKTWTARTAGRLEGQL